MRNHLRSLAFVLPLVALPLAACGTSTPVVTEAPRLVIPASLKTCPPQPEPPPDSAADVDFWDWVVDLAAAGQSCRDTLSAVIETIGQ